MAKVLYMQALIVMSTARYDALPPEHRTILKEASAQAAANAQHRKDHEASPQTMRKSRLPIFDPDQARFRATAAVVHEALRKDVPMAPMVRQDQDGRRSAGRLIARKDDPSMNVLDHARQDVEAWREGVDTRMRVSALTNAHQLCIFEQFCAPGLGAPIHIHAVEEVLEVMEGEAEITLGDESRVVTADQSVVIPAGMRHGFRNIGTGILKVRATLAAAIFEASYDARSELSRRYTPP